MISFTVYGKPQSRGSKNPRNLKYKDGRLVMRPGTTWPVIVTADDNPQSKGWMEKVTAVARLAVGDDALIAGPVCLGVRCFFRRPKCHYRTGRYSAMLKASAPRFHTSKPDASKLIRPIEDALTGVVYVDDSQIVEYAPGPIKQWTEAEERAEITVDALEELPLLTAADAAGGK